MADKFCISEDVFVSVSEFRGKPRVDIRKWYETKEGELAPGKNGLNIDAETWEDLSAKWEEIQKYVEEHLKK